MRVLCLVLCLLPGLVTAAQERHRYLEITGGKAIQFDWSAEQYAGGLRIVASEPGKQFLTLCDTDGVTSYWHLSDALHDIQAERNGDRLVLHGSRYGQTYTEEHRLDASPWFQAMSYSLRAWLATDAESIEFWSLRPDTLEPVKLQATRLDNQRIETRAGSMEAIPVRVRAVGLLAALWKADYWFRAADRVFVRYQAVNGLPGTAETIIELLPENRAAVSSR